MAQGVAWMARELGVPATIVVPDNASASKLAAVERLGGRIVRLPWEQWWAAVAADTERDLGDDVEGYFVHPVQDDPVMAGNGTIGLELMEDLDAFDAVLIPWGGGGLTTGVASAVQALRPQTKIYVCEPETGAPVAAAIANRRVPKSIDFTPSFVDGAGSGSLLPKMWAHAESLVTDAFPISLEDAAAGVRVLLERGTRSRADVEQIPMVWSGGTDGVLTPHATVFARVPSTAGERSDGAARLSVGVAMSDVIPNAHKDVPTQSPVRHARGKTA